MRILIIALILLSPILSFSQRIYGTVYNEAGEVLPFASVTIKGTSSGTSANNSGLYSLNLSPGNYTVVCQYIGYTANEQKITVVKDVELNFTLKEQKLVMKEVVVKSGAEDPAYAIIREAIKKRPFYNKQVTAFSADIYGKDIIKLRKLPKKVFGQKIGDEERADMGVDSAGKGIMYLSESVSRAYKQEPDKFKQEVISSRVSGSSSFGFTFPAFISLYTNNVTVFSDRFNPRGFISPIADGAIGFYKYKFLGTFFEDGRAVNSIRVTPRRNYEPLFSGIINITDNDWRIHSFDLLLTKTSQLEILDSLKISQLHVPVSNDVWRTKNQLLYFNFKLLGIDAIGNFLSVYSDYNIDPAFTKKFFDRVVIKYDTAVNKRSIAYWDSVRAVPLEPEEIRDYTYKDSVFKRQRDSMFSKRNIDSLNKKRSPIKLASLVTTGIHRTKYTTRGIKQWGINPLLFNTEYNTAEGLAVNFGGYISSRKHRGSEVSFEPLLRYGFTNGHLNPSAAVIVSSRVNENDKKLKHYVWKVEAGKRVSEYNAESVMHPITNTFRILIDGKNFMKTYENYFGGISFSKRYESGVAFSVSTLYEDRFLLNNSTNYTFRKKDSSNITPNYPVLDPDGLFARHQVFITSLQFSFKPGQRYIQLPNTKIPIGSKYPTFSFRYSKAIAGLFGSDADFDKWQFAVTDDKNLKLLGAFGYRFGIGGFLNNRNVFIQDKKHFNRNSGKLNSFQLVDFYANSNAASLYIFGHVEHHFNGLITNKIPLFKRLNWNLVAGSNAFYIDKQNNYVELFVGLENIFKALRIDFVAGYEPGKPVRTGIRFSPGGLMGTRAAAQVSRRGNSINLEL